MPFHTTRLSSGLQLIGETLPSARSAAVGFFVRTGSRDETAMESGVSHFLEHMVFKGTDRRSAEAVNLDFDRIGASYNAYTSEENTVYYAAVLPEYLSTAVDILADVLRPSLRTSDFDTEKKVILEEIKMYEDVPGSMAWEHSRSIYYGKHPLGQSILGTNASVSALTAEQMRAYFDRRYVASNILVAAAGKFDWDEFVKLVESATAKWPDADAKRTNLTEARGPGGVHPVVKEGTAQQHALLFSAGPSAEDPLRYAASVLANAIGDDSGSRLHWELVDPGLVESASCSLDPSQGNGTIVTSYSCDPEQAAANLAILNKVLTEVQKDGITEEELTQSKNKIASRVVRASERPMGRMRSIAGAWLYNGEYSDPDVELARYDAVDNKTIRQLLDRYPLTTNTVIGYGPLAKLD
jgi:predicted Zn-dependent peptidase